MYSSAHGVIGAMAVTVVPDPVAGLAVAFFSHFVLDYIGEASIGNTKQSALIEGALLLVYLIGAALSPSPWLYIAAWIAANLPDLIDKPMRWIFGRKEWFSCHNGKGLFQYKGRKLGYPVLYNLNYTTTLLCNIGGTVVFFLLMLAVHF